jgi:hypothetical protein
MKAAFAVIGLVILALVVGAGGGYSRASSHSSHATDLAVWAQHGPSFHRGSSFYGPSIHGPVVFACGCGRHYCVIGMCHQAMPEVASFETGKKTERGLFKKPSFSVVPETIQDQAHSCFVRPFEPTFRFAQDRDFGTSVFLSTSRLLL